MRFDYVSVVIEFAIQSRMHAGQVVTFEIVIHIRLPIALHLISPAFEQFHPGKMKLLGLLRQFAQALAQRTRILIQVHEDETEPLLDPHRRQSKVFRTKSFDAFNLGGAEQRSIETVGPSVISAAKYFAGTAAFGRRTGAVPAHVIEAAQLAVAIANDQQRLADQLGRKVVAGVCHLVAMPHHLPAPHKDSLFLGRKRIRLGVEMRGQSPGPRNIGIDGTNTFRSSHRFRIQDNSTAEDSMQGQPPRLPALSFEGSLEHSSTALTTGPFPLQAGSEPSFSNRSQSSPRLTGIVRVCDAFWQETTPGKS